MKNKIFFIIFMITWILLVVLNIFSPKEIFSEQENRYLASIPRFSYKDLVNGKYADNLNTYINDHFIIRNFWLKLNSFIQISTGKKENNGVYIGKDNYLFEKYRYGYDERNNIEKISNTVNKFAQKVKIPTYFMLVPNSNYIYKEKLPDNVELYDQSIIINELYEKINDYAKTIDVTNILKNNKENQQLYFRTDHHMTSYGAYLLYTEFCNSNDNLNAKMLSDFKKKVISTDFLGTLDSKAQIFNQRKDCIEVYLNDINMNVEGVYDGKVYHSMFNEEYLKQKDKYSYFLNGNYSKVVIKTKVDNEKKLLIIKDSYAHIMSQFICQNYEEVHFLDPRYYNASISDYIVKNKIDEVLFLYNVSNLLTDISLRGIK